MLLDTIVKAPACPYLSSESSLQSRAMTAAHARNPYVSDDDILSFGDGDILFTQPPKFRESRQLHMRNHSTEDCARGTPPKLPGSLKIPR
eukprot:402402-Amphidinium_carterae.1